MMKRFIKYGVISVATFLVLLIATIIVLPVVVNVQKYIPEIETQLSSAAGRPVSIGSDLGLSFFPWLSISLSDLKIGNPKGYPSGWFVKIGSFETRIKVLPLLWKQVDVSRFIIGGLEVNLEKRSDGRGNWDFSTKNSSKQDTDPAYSAMTGWSLPKNLSSFPFCHHGRYRKLAGRDWTLTLQTERSDAAPQEPHPPETA